MEMRIGQGFDVHALVEGRTLILGGVQVPFPRGLAGHSDADVLVHAICDALLGAVALGDIGRHFPDSDPVYAGADSRVLLRHCITLLRGQGYVPVNVDSTLVCQRPRLAPFIPEMRHHLAQDMGLPLEAVSVKATTTEHLGFAGREEGIAAQAVCLVRHA